MRLFYTIFISLFFLTNAMCQKHYLNIPIYLDFNKLYIDVLDNKDSSVVTSKGSDSSRMLRVFNANVKGSLHFLVYDETGHIKLEGGYISSSKIMTEKIKVKRLNGRSEIIDRHFYKPLRQGTWKYYSEGRIYLTEVYKKGVLSNTSN